MKDFHLLDHCLSDFFPGHHLPVFQIPVYGPMTYKEVAEALKDEYNQLSDLYESYDEKEIEKALEKLANQDGMYVDSPDLRELDELPDDFIPTYLFFVFGTLTNNPVIPAFKYVE